MAITDLSGPADDGLDWYRALYGGQASPTAGAAGMFVPGGGAMQYPAASGQGPYMGYPALPGAPGPGQGQPAAQSSPPLFQIGLPNQKPWLSIGNPNVQFGGFHPGNAVNPDFWRDLQVTKSGIGGILGAASQGQPTDSGALVGAGDTSLQPGPSTLPQARGTAAPPASAAAGPYTAMPWRGPIANPYTAMPWRGPIAGQPAASANAPSAAAQPVSAVQPAAVHPAVAAAAAQAANPRFSTFQYNVPGSSNQLGSGGQGGRNAPIYTAMNLGGLFGGGQPAAAPAAQPRVAGPLAANPSVGTPATLISPTTGQPMPMSSADVAYGLPDARGAPYPYKLGGPSDYRSMGDTPDVLAATRRQAAAQLAAASLKQRYG